MFDDRVPFSGLPRAGFSRLRYGAPPTPRQARVLEVVRAHVHRTGRFPSVRAIARQLVPERPPSTNAIHGHLVALEQRGLLLRRPGWSLPGQALGPAATSPELPAAAPGDADHDLYPVAW